MRALKAIKLLMLGCAVAVVLAAPAAAIDFSSARVSGNFVYQGGTPADNRQLHFQNRASGDMFVAATDSRGDFAAHLPPGVYDLRAERGVILKAKILVVGNDDFNIGRVTEPAPLDVRRPFERQGVAEEIVQSPAPTTANMKGRPMESLKQGHTLVQLLYGPAKPLPPIPAPQPALPTGPAPPPAAAASPAAP
jgi:hypothetical protein